MTATESGLLSGPSGNVAALWSSDTGATWRLVAQYGEAFLAGCYLAHAGNGFVIVIGDVPDPWVGTLAAP